MGTCTNHVDRILGIFDPPPPMWTLLLNSCYKVLMSSEQPPLPLVCPRGLYTPPFVQCCTIVTLKKCPLVFTARLAKNSAQNCY